MERLLPLAKASVASSSYISLLRPEDEGIALVYIGALVSNLIEEASMVVIPKIVGVMSCSFLLCLVLLGNMVSATAEMKTDQAGERIGGQAGQEYDQGKWEHVAAQAGERVGGQAG